MKKTLLYLVLIVGFIANAQTDYYTALPNNNSTSGNGRAPQGATKYNRSIWLITAAEMTASGFTNGSVVNSLGFNYSTAQNIATTGNIVIYLQNTADATNTKSTTWATAIGGMTTVSNGSVTLPAATGTFDIPFAGGSPFTYTGGALYVAFDYQNAANPIATTANAALCSTTLANGLKSAFSATAAPATIAASNFRPETRLGKQVTCARPTALGFNTPALNSANLTFNVTAGGTVTLEYGPYGFVQGTGTTVNSVTSPYNVTGLAPNSTYEYYVRKDCGGGNLSVWEGPYPFYTIFQSTAPTYNTSFEHVDFPFVGWLAVPNNTANAWFINYGGPGSALVQQGESSAVAITPAAAAANERLFSRGINLTAGSTTTITYYVRNYQAATTALANYQLTVGTDQTAASQTTVLATETGISNTAFAQKTYNFTPPSTGTYYFSFLHNSPMNPTANSTHALIIDNVTVTEVLSTKDFLFSKIAVYPNPATDFVTISNTAAIEINSVEIVDVNGRIVKALTPKNTPITQINIADLTAGVYFMNIKTSEGSGTKKIVKE
ncbi:T9SS type A sorting domain-containing protein [Flavobacterium humi]|uniref:T9SS type A sorting domain-containing protein n=1 Tax=Flavobacterium humi TaxID=2562683 RepID=A0A4Z0LC55_9FLAO|nr:T9SS type A sorting domain-containing protein [Flavobacterium humi]TGD59453.1 T9SS type A sorting domain-containing protein [Flavobacterium humi]